MAAERLRESHRRLSELIQPVVEREGYELYDLDLKREGGRRGGLVLRLMIDRAGRTHFGPERDDQGRLVGGVSLDDCVRVSKALGPVLDVEDPIDGAYHLEVSSAGVERPLTKAVHFARAVGLHIKVALKVPVGDRRKLGGEVLAADDEQVTLAVGGEEVVVPLRLVDKAHLDYFHDGG